MASSMLTGDRRWAPTRKGMTVLGKVPKPINLPSQRLENHGLDPNVEIVPKGTLTWGSKPSSTLPNVWASSTLLSPNTDSSGSPSHVNGRPSSGESSTRPSTAGSDKSHDPACNAWGPNSRPSSASGPLTSNQTSIMVARPRSAETRSSSTQLSRFAESPVVSTVAWGATRIAERVGAAPSKNNKFTLSSGDFPTLGSDKNSESQMQRGHGSHERPGSASGTAATQKGPRPLSAGDGNYNANSWKEDGYPVPNLNRQRDPQHAQPTPSANVPPHQFGPWHSAPIDSPNGVWYRGGAVCVPYKPAAPPGSYPIEPYSYHPQFLARPPPNSEPVPGPRPLTSPSGYHPKNGDSYHQHQPPDSYMIPGHPVIPVSPGLYPSPVPYEGYYGPPHASFCNPSDGNAHAMGISKQNAILEPGKFHARPGGHVSVMAMEQKESEHAHETRPGRYKVLQRQHDCWEDKTEAQERREKSVIPGPQHDDRGILPGATTQEEEWRRKDERTVFLNLAPGQEASSQPSSDCEGHISDSCITNSLANSSKEADDSLTRKPETATFPVHDQKQDPVTKKNATLIGKINGLNSKSSNHDVHSGGEEKAKHFMVANKTDYSKKLVSINATSAKYAPTSDTVNSASDELDHPTENKNRRSLGDGNVFPRTSESLVCAANMLDSSEVGEKGLSQFHIRGHVMRGRVDDHAKLRSNSPDDNEWIKKSSGRDSLVMSTMASGETGSGNCLLDCHASQEATEESHHAANAAGVSYATSSLDSIDLKAQRAKLKELAIRRSKELQEEEEQRTREQKARALAKLEELNRRKQTLAQSVNQKNPDLTPNGDVRDKQDSGTDADIRIDAIIIESPGPVSAQKSNATMQANDCETKNLSGLTDLTSDTDSQDAISATQDSATPHDHFLSPGQEKSTDEVVTHVTSSDFDESSVSNQKQMGSRRADISPEENPSVKPITAESMGSPKYTSEVGLPTTSSDGLPNSVETSVPHRKRSNRNARNKNKLDEALTSSTLLSSAPKEEGIERGPTEGGNTQTSTYVADTTPDPTRSSSGQASVISSNQGWPQATEKMHGRVGNQWKRKTARNQQALRPVDKFHGSEAVFWAPVRPSNKTEPSEEVIQNSTPESSNYSSGKNGQDTQNCSKTKRAEMERYVPKPVVKEPSQQDNSQEPSTTLDLAASGSVIGKLNSTSKGSGRGTLDDSALGKPEFATDTRNREVKNKPGTHGKIRASWCQRVSVQSPLVEPSKPWPEPSDQNKASKLDSSPEEQLQYDEWNSKNDDSVPTEGMNLPTVVKDQGVPNEQRCQQSAIDGDQLISYAPTGNKDRSPALNLMNESGQRNASRTRNQSSGGEHPRYHWKPKCQPYSHDHRPENRGDGGQRVAPQRVGSDQESSQSQGIEDYSLQNKYKKATAQRTGGAEGSTAHYREVKRERKIILDQSEEEPPSADRNLFSNAEVAAVNVDAQHKQPVSSGQRRLGHDNNQLNRGQEATYRVMDLMQDDGKQILHMNGGDRRKGNPRFEYRRNGSYDKAGDSIQENPVIGGEAREGPRAPGLRYREHGQSQSRRGGHFYRQRTTGADVQAGD